MYCYLALDGMLVHRRDMVSAVFRWYPLKDLASVVQKVDNAIPVLKIHSGLLQGILARSRLSTDWSKY